MLIHIARRDAFTGWSAEFWAEVPPCGFMSPPALTHRRLSPRSADPSEAWFSKLDKRFVEPVLHHVKGPAVNRNGLWTFDGWDLPDDALGCCPVSFDGNSEEYIVGFEWARKYPSLMAPPIVRKQGPYVYDYLVAAPRGGETEREVRARFDSVAHDADALFPAALPCCYLPVVVRTKRHQYRPDLTPLRFADLHRLASVYGASFAAAGYAPGAGRQVNNDAALVAGIARAYAAQSDPTWSQPTLGVSRFLSACGFPCAPDEPSAVSFL